MESSWKAGSDLLLLRPMIRKGKLVGSFGTLDESYSVSGSVSSSACCFDSLTGFPDALKTRTVLSDSSLAKCTFFKVHLLASQVRIGCAGVSGHLGRGVRSEMT